MKLKDFLYFLLLLSLAVSLPVRAEFHANNNDLFQKGLTEKEAGNFEEAALIWIRHAENSEVPDYRVAHELIKLVTGHRLTQFYEKSSEIYFHGLTTTVIDKEEQSLLYDELFCIDGMLGQRETRRLKRMIDDKDPAFLSFLEDFWRDRSLTFSDNYNERLLEHWERVNYSLEHFNTSPRALFDDRGKIYIRFGEPFRKRSGIFMYNPGFANYVLAARMDDGRGGGDVFENEVQTTTFLNTLYMVREYHQYPSFEVWVYNNLAESPDNIIYLFGNSYGGSEMRFKQSVDDFVPSAAYSNTQRNNPLSMSILSSAGGDGVSDVEAEMGGGVSVNLETVSPALVLQFMYYRQLASLDDYFSSRYTEMMDRYMNTSFRLSRSTAREFQHTNASRLLITNRLAPDEKTSNTNAVFDIRPGLFPYRFYDENLKPYLKVYFDEDIEEAISYKELRNRNDVNDIRFEDYELNRTIKLFSGMNEEVKRITSRSPIVHNTENPLRDRMVEIPVNQKFNKILVHSELYDKTANIKEAISENSTFRESLIGIGATEAAVQPHEEEGQLFASDIIIGYTLEDDNEKGGRLVITHNRAIPENSIMSFYYEAYNIPINEERLYSYSLTYKITRQRSGLGRIFRFGKSTYSSMSIENTHDSPHFSQLLEIVSDDLNPGSYTLELVFTADHAPDAYFIREIDFTVD